MTKKISLKLSSFFIVAFAALFIQATAFAAPTPIKIDGNPSCATLNASTDPAFAHITSGWEFKVDPPVAGILPLTGAGVGGGMSANPNMSLSLAYSSSQVLTNWSLSWLAPADLDRLVSAVIVKGGPNGANVYVYDPLNNGDSGSFTVPGGNNAISHLTFCFEKYDPPPPPPPTTNIVIIKEVQTIDNTGASTASFNFTSSQAIFGANRDQTGFALVDNNNVTLDRAEASAAAGSQVVVTEPAAVGWTLLDITCDSEAAVTNLGAGTATITAPATGVVTCTFKNGQLRPSAADGSVTGRVFDANGRPISGAIITVVDYGTGKTTRVSTNTFGYYSVKGLEVMNLFGVTVSHSRYRFNDATRIFQLEGDLADVSFSAAR